MKKILLALCSVLVSLVSVAQGFDIEILLLDKSTHSPILMANCVLDPFVAATTTDFDGKATLKNVPQGKYFLNISYVGFVSIHQEIDVNQNLNLKIELEENTLAISEVVVTAKQNAAGKSTSSQIGRQAIDHLQATSLADVMQLIPGQEMGNQSMTSQQNIQIRQLVNNKTSAFGASVVVDGVPMSNNGNVTQGTFSSTSFEGTDLRQISADDIESVEVVRGIPSAEYGDLTSGLVIVHSKIGVTPWQAKAKINPGLQNYSLGKGLKLKNKDVLNFNFDYARAWGDPRMKTVSFNRYTMSAGYSHNFSSKWHTDTKLRITLAKDWNGNDPDAVQDGTQNEVHNNRYAITHNGKISLDRKFARSLNYTIGFSYTDNHWEKSSYKGTAGQILPILTATETGYYEVSSVVKPYLATGYNENHPGNFIAKISDNFHLRNGHLSQSFKVGVEYNLDWNNGRGYYNEDNLRPYQPNSDGRPRSYSDVPAIHKFSAYAEDNIALEYWGERQMKLQIGARATMLQPFGDVSTYAVSPRVNYSIELTKWVDLRAGIGLNSKTPGLAYIYPDKKYTDNLAARYTTTTGESDILVYHTFVQDIKYSDGLKNATTTKVEGGITFTLPHDHKLNVTAYHDKTPNGFSSLTDYITYPLNYYSQNQGIIVGTPSTIDYDNPEKVYTVFVTTGMVGNEDVTVNKGVEFDLDCGEIKLIRTTFYLSGAAQSTKTYSKSLTYKSPTASGSYPSVKLAYKTEDDYNLYKQFLTTLRTVTHIPALRMVVSLSCQVIWSESSHEYIAAKMPIGYLDSNLDYHEITPSMHNGYIGSDGVYYSQKPANSEVTIANEAIINREPETEQPRTWFVSGRLTKELGKSAGLSFYANNMFFYEPFRTSSSSNTLVQRNTGKFGFGIELFFNF